MVTVVILVQIAESIDKQGMHLTNPVDRIIGAGQLDPGPEDGLIGGAFTTAGSGNDRSGRSGSSAGPDGLKGLSERGFQLAGV